MYKNIIFDLGGVIVDFAPRVFLVDHFMNEVLEDELYAITFGSDEWKLLDSGSITREQGNQIMREKGAAIGRSFEVDIILNDWADMLRTKDDMAHMLKNLRKSGYRLLYLSNIPADILQELKTRRFWSLFHGGVASCEAHINKPDPRIFSGTLRKFSLQPSETIFIDDTAANVEGAKAAGMTAIQFISASELTRALEGYGVHVKK